MISTRDMQVLFDGVVPAVHGGGRIQLLGKSTSVVGMPFLYIKRMVARNNVVTLIDRYDHVNADMSIELCPLNIPIAQKIIEDILAGKKSWAACFMQGHPAGKQADIPWEKSRQEHRYTSTGIKFWRHKAAMQAYRANTGNTVISTHISPEGACNLKCPFCSVTRRETHSRIALPRIQKYVTDLQSRGLKAVILTGGGEPTLYPQFNELVRWLKWDRKLSVALITNGTMSHKVNTWAAFSWVRVSINIFDGWREKIVLPRNKLAADCVVGASMIYTVEHEATHSVPFDRVELFKQVSEVATKIGAKYIRVLPNCLLEQNELILQHRSIKEIAEQLGDERFFQQYKVHGAPDADVCHQSYFRPYLSEEPWHGDGEPGTVYPCDSVVLNDSVAHFGQQWQLCKPEGVLDYMDGKIAQRFKPRTDCSGCVFTSNVEMLGKWKQTGEGVFPFSPLVHEEFV